MTELILGPPGTGKTTTLLGIVDDELIAHTAPDRIGYISFTRRAAEEAIMRATIKFGISRKALPWFRTIHSLCFRFMGLSSGVVLEGKRMEEFADVVGERITGRFNMEDGTYLGYEPGDRMLFMNNLARVRGVTLEQQYNEDYDEIEWFRFKRFSEALTAFKTENGLIDYTDMLEQFVSSPVTLPLDVLIVDEAQDLSALQWRVVAKLAKGCRRVVVAGDDDQAIYRWAGADGHAMSHIMGHVRVLGQSWRVPPEVQGVAQSIIHRVKERMEKEWAPRSGHGQVKWHRKLEAVDWSGEEDVLVMARNANILSQVESSLHGSGMYYERHGVPSVKPATIRAIMVWERLRAGEEVMVDDVQPVYDMLRSGEQIARGHKSLQAFRRDEMVTMDVLKARGGLRTDRIWHEALDKIPPAERSYIVRCRRRGEKLNQQPRIRLSTIHGSKGAEASRVVLLTDMAPRTEMEYHRSPDDEHRTWYVATTRAKNTLEIVGPRTSKFYGI